MSLSRFIPAARAAAMSGLVVLGLSACGSHTPTNGGGVFGHTGGPITYQSTESSQTSVRMVDTRSGEVFFSLDIPVGQQLTYDFERGDGDDAVYTPDLMRYEVKNIGDKYGKLKNAMTAPNAASRRVDVFVKQTPHYANQPPESAALRTDQPSDRPDWWSPRGGAMPASAGSSSMYDN